MSWDTSTGDNALINANSLDLPFVWLLEVEVPTTPPSRVRICRYTESIDYGVNSSGQAINYEPFPFSIEKIEEDSEGTLPSIAISVSNVTREIQALLEAYGGLIGQVTRLMLVNVTDLNGSPLLEYAGEVVSLTASESAVVFEVAAFRLASQPVPSKRALSDFCRFKYKGGRCGYTGALPTCDKVLGGDNGCEAHANQERFGGFPSMPRNLT